MLTPSMVFLIVVFSERFAVPEWLAGLVMLRWSSNSDTTIGSCAAIFRSYMVGGRLPRTGHTFATAESLAGHESLVYLSHWATMM